MKVLVATRQTQGAIAGDFCHTVEGELVTPHIVECADPERCGCGRAFSGLASDRATTTAMVVDLDHVDRAALAAAVRDNLERWGIPGEVPDEEVDDEVADHLEAIEWACAGRPVGTIVRRNGAEMRITRAA